MDMRKRESLLTFLYFYKSWSDNSLFKPLRYLHHIVFGHQDRLFFLQAVGASLTPNLGPLDPGGLMGRAGPEGEKAGEDNGFGQLLSDGLMGHFSHIHHSIRIDQACRRRRRRRERSCYWSCEMLFLIAQLKRLVNCFLWQKHFVLSVLLFHHAVLLME